MPGRADYLDAIARDVLGHANDALTAARTGHAAPTRSYVSHGTPAVPLCSDGTGQVSVHLDHIEYRGLVLSAQTPRTKPVVPVGDYRIQLWRCVPTLNDDGQAPDADAEGEAAFGLNVDAWCLAPYIARLVAASRLVTSVRVGGISVANGRALPRQGMSAGWELGLSVALDNPPEEQP